MPTIRMPARRQKQRRLGTVILAVVVIWGFILPRLEQSHLIQARIRHLHRHGVNPAAFFYTDHEGMDRWEKRIRAARQSGANTS